jgi:hypothetical protein
MPKIHHPYSNYNHIPPMNYIKSVLFSHHDITLLLALVFRHLIWEVLFIIFLCTLLFVSEPCSALCPLSTQMLYCRLIVLKYSWAISCIRMDWISQIFRNCQSLCHQSLRTVPKTLEIHNMNECPRVFHCTYMLWKFQIFNIYILLHIFTMYEVENIF